MKIVITSGYFDPLHVGHVEYLELAKKLGDKLIVIVNNDAQAVMKKGKSFMPLNERIKIIEALKPVDEIFESIDMDRSVCKSIEFLSKRFKGSEIIFAKGGDRTIGEIPETGICRENGIEIIDGLGKKIQSSSELVKKSMNQNGQ